MCVWVRTCSSFSSLTPCSAHRTIFYTNEACAWACLLVFVRTLMSAGKVSERKRNRYTSCKCSKIGFSFLFLSLLIDYVFCCRCCCCCYCLFLMLLLLFLCALSQTANVDVVFLLGCVATWYHIRNLHHYALDIKIEKPHDLSTPSQ